MIYDPLKVFNIRMPIALCNQVVQTFYITLTPVDDAIPMVINNGLRAQEGVRKLLTEFDLKAVDPDTKVGSLTQSSNAFRMQFAQKLSKEDERLDHCVVVSSVDYPLSMVIKSLHENSIAIVSDQVVWYISKGCALVGTSDPTRCHRAKECVAHSTEWEHSMCSQRCNIA